MRNSGMTILNQAVLLKGVNDSIKTLKHLSLSLFEIEILPYYLHLLDPVAGTAHFDIPLAKATQLHNGLRDSLSGYLVPKLVREIAGQKSKTAASDIPII